MNGFRHSVQADLSRHTGCFPCAKFELDKKFTLISGIDLGESFGNMRMVWRFIRTDIKSKEHIFYVYMDYKDVDVEHTIVDIKEPFPTPKKRVKETQGRGKFRLEL